MTAWWTKSLCAVVLASLAVIVGALASNTASANGPIDLRPHLCSAVPPDAGASQARQRHSTCGPVLAHNENSWTWVRLDDPRRLEGLAGGWHLLLPHRQLDAILVVITYRDGTVERIGRLNGALSVDWSPAGHASFVSSRAGSDVVALMIGYRSKNARSTLKYVKVASAPLFSHYAANFQLVVGLFLGAVGSALIYNLFIGVGARYAFQRVYTAWCILALMNGLLASGVLNGLWPALAGPVGILANKFVLAMLFACGTWFLLALLEDGILPRALVRIGVFAAVAIGATGPLAVIETVLPFGFVGQLTTLFTAINIVVVASIAVVAALRRSRTVWFYLAGWTPILIFGFLLVAYDVGVLAHSQLMDVGGMLAIAFESVVLSLAIADRFRLLQRERDELERAQHMAEADRAALQNVADTDQLTGLSNRRVFDETLAAARQGEIEKLALILIDVDRFKGVNDRFGHEAGDELLTQIAQQLSSNVRANDVVARLGGDEFAILLKGEDARHLDQIIKGLLAAQRHAAPSARGEVTFSIGAALFPDDDTNSARLYKNADLALYEAKRLGRARSHRYSPRLRSHDERRLSLA